MVSIKRAAAAIAVAASATVLGIAAPPASAGWSDCPAGALCAYLAPNGAGTPGKVFGDNANLLQYTKFDNAESLYNNGNNCNVEIYSGLNWSGYHFNLARGWAAPDLGGTVWYHNVASNDWCV